MKINKGKRLLSIFVALVMILSIMPNALADERLTDGSTKADIIFELMTYVDDTSSGTTNDGMTSQTSIVRTMTDADANKPGPGATAGTEFLVGVKVANLNNIKIGTEGLNSLFINFTYNTDYIEYNETSDAANVIANNIYRFGGMNTANLFGIMNMTNKYQVITDGTGADTSTGTITYSIGPSVATNRYSGNDAQYIMAMKFKLKVDAPTTNVPNVIQFNSNSFNISFGEYGIAGDYEATNDSTAKDIRPLFNIDTSALNFYGNITGQATLESISKRLPATYTVPEQYTGKPLDIGNLILQTDMSDGTHEDIAANDSKLSFAYADANDITDATSNDLTAISGDFSSAMANKYLYAVYDGKLLCLGQFSVTESGIDTITADTSYTFGKTQGKNYYTTDTVGSVLTGQGAETLPVNLHYNNGDTENNVAVGSYGSKGVALYRTYVDADDGDKVKVQKVIMSGDNATKFNAGTNNFLVALDDVADGTVVDSVTPKSAVIQVTGTADTLVITKVENAKLKYDENATAPQNVINFDNADITTYTSSQGAGTAAATKVSANKSNYIFYLGSDNDPANNGYVASASTVIQSGTTAYVEATHKDKYVYVVPADNTSATPVLVGQLTNRAIDTTPSVIATNSTANPPTSVAHGTTLADARPKNAQQEPQDLTVTLKYDNGDTETYTLATLPSNVKARIVSAGQTPTTLADNISNTTPLTTQMSGGKIQFYTGTDPNVTVLAEATVPTITKKEVKVNISNPTANITKVYDGTKDLPANTTVGTIAFDGFTTDDATAANGNIKIAGLTYEYDAEDVPAAANGRKIVAKVDATNGLSVVRADDKTATDITDAAITALNANYTFVLGTGFDATDKSVVAANITPLALNVTAIPATAIQHAIATQTDFVNPGKEGQLVLNHENSNVKTRDDGAVTLKFTYKYKADQIGSAKSDADVDLSNYSLDGQKKGNYLVTGSDATPTAVSLPTDMKGVIDNQNIERIAIHENTLPTTYTYPGTTLDLANTILDMYFQGSNDPVQMSLADFLAKGTIALSQNKAGESNVGITDTNKSSELLPYGTPKLTFVYNNDEQHKLELPLTVKKKPINIKDLPYVFKKTYDGSNTADKEIEGTDVAALENADKDDVTIKYTVTFDDSNSGEMHAAVTSIELEGSEDYELVMDDAEDVIPVPATGEIPAAKQPQTSAATAPAEIDPAPLAAPANVTTDRKVSSNNIEVTAPVNDETHKYMYSMDDGATWQESPIFTGLDQDKTYPIAVKAVPVDGDTNHTDSEKTVVSVTTYKYKVEARIKKNATNETPDYYGYTDDTTLADANAVHAIVNGGSKPSRWKAYFTDADATVALEDNYSIANNAVNKVLKLYYTQTSGGSGGGGGGGVSSYIAKFDASANGTITEGKASVSVTSGNTVQAASVPTVTPKEGYTFVGWSTDGTTVVDPTTVAITKGTTFTALYEKEPEATPTPAPTDAPVPTEQPAINKDFTEPYASGYEDGSFGPDNNLTRAELATMIARLIEGTDVSSSYRASFYDVPADAWYSKYIGYLEDKNVLSGYEDGSFRPDNQVSRGEIATVIARAQKFAIDSYAGGFTDVTDYDWAKDYIQTLANRGIASGYPDGTFGPYASITRAEAVTMINKVLAESTPVVTFTPNDIAGHWAQAEVLLAVNKRELTSAPAPAPTEEPVAEPEVTEEPAQEEETTEVTEETTETTEATEAPEATETPAE